MRGNCNINIYENKISGKQFGVIVASFIQSAVLQSAYLAKNLEIDAWLIQILGIILTLPFVLIIFKFFKEFSGKNLTEILQNVFGVFIGKTVSFLYILFFIFLASIYLNETVTSLKQTLFPNLSALIVAVIIMLVCGFTALSGSKTFARIGAGFVIVNLTIVLVNLFLSGEFANLDGLFSIFQNHKKESIKNFISVLIYPFAEIMALMIFLPKIDVGRGAVEKKHLSLAYLIGALSVVGTAFSSVGVKSENFETFINILNLLMLVFRLSIYLFLIVQSFASIFKLQNPKNFIFVFASIIVMMTISLIAPQQNHFKLNENLFIVSGAIFQMIIPLITMISAAIKKLLNSNKEKSRGRQGVKT